jgi:hypothetical protein
MKKIKYGTLQELGFLGGKCDWSYISELSKKMKESDPDASRALALAKKYGKDGENDIAK